MKRSTQFAASVLQRTMAALLAVLLFVRPLPLPAEAPRAGAPPAPQPTMLQITILDGEGALNNIRARTAREPIVEVDDENHKPVAGALILFSIRSNGAGGTFNGSASTSLYTDANGRAVAHGFHPNRKTGKYVIEVTAVAGAVTALILIHETNIRGPVEDQGQNDTQASGSGNPNPHHHHHTGRNVTIAATATAVAIVLILVLTRHHSTDITTGTGTVGHP
jgi:hypothetical protein